MTQTGWRARCDTRYARGPTPRARALLLQARKEQVAAGRKSEATFGFYRE